MPNTEKLLEMLKSMHRIRSFEERVKVLFQEGLIKGSAHLCIGQEAVAVGVCAALEKTDYILSTHRGHGHCLAKGGDPLRTMAEIMGKETGYCKGRGGSMHLFDTEIGLLGGNGIVGGGIPIALGIGVSAQNRGSRQVVVTFFGDGAANHGTFHESLNIASLWKLPILFVCENNLYANTTPFHLSTSVPNVADRASAYNVPGVVVDGNDVVGVYEVASEAVARARDKEGPTLMECKTYRFEAHTLPGIGQGRDRDPAEIEHWKSRDPISILEKSLVEAGILAVEQLTGFRAEAAQEMDEAEQFSRKSPYPAVGSLGLGPRPVFAGTT